MEDGKCEEGGDEEGGGVEDGKCEEGGDEEGGEGGGEDGKWEEVISLSD